MTMLGKHREDSAELSFVKLHERTRATTELPTEMTHHPASPEKDNKKYSWLSHKF